jgi:hypothetical protein
MVNPLFAFLRQRLAAAPEFAAIVRYDNGNFERAVQAVKTSGGG